MSAALVSEQQRLVAGVDVDLAQTGVRLDVHPAGAHELQRPLDVARDLLVAAALRARRHELLGPGVHAVEGGEPALGERPQQVQRRGRLMVGLHEAVGRGDPGRGGGRRVVHAVAAEHGDLVVADQLGERRPGLGELTGDPADLHDRHPHRVHEDDRHLEDHAQLLTDVVGGEVLEALGAVACLEQERVAGRDLRQPGLQRTRLPGEHQRRKSLDLLECPLEVAVVGPLGLLPGGMVVPRGRCPRRCHDGEPTGGRNDTEQPVSRLLGGQRGMWMRRGVRRRGSARRRRAGRRRPG